MSGSAEAIDTEMLSLPRHHQGAPADQAGTQQGRNGNVVVCLAERKAIAGVSDKMGGKPSVARVSGKERTIAQILAAALAIVTLTAGVSEPGNAHALAYFKGRQTLGKRLHPADDLVARDDGIGGVRQFSVHDMQIGPAHAASADSDTHRPGSRHRIISFQKLKRHTGRRQDHRVHVVAVLTLAACTVSNVARAILILVKGLGATVANILPPVRLNQKVHMNTKSVIPVGTQRAVTRRDRNPFSFLQHEIDRLFDGVSRNIPGLATTAMPSMDISETDKVIEITAESPGWIRRTSNSTSPTVS